MGGEGWKEGGGPPCRLDGSTNRIQRMIDIEVGGEQGKVDRGWTMERVGRSGVGEDGGGAYQHPQPT